MKATLSAGGLGSQMQSGFVHRLKEGFGFIRSNRSVDYYFRPSDFDGDDSLLKVGLAVEFTVSTRSNTRVARVKPTSALRSMCKNPKCQGQKSRHFADACPFGLWSPPAAEASKKPLAAAEASKKPLASLEASKKVRPAVVNPSLGSADSRSWMSTDKWHDVRVAGPYCGFCKGPCRLPR